MNKHELYELVYFVLRNLPRSDYNLSSSAACAFIADQVARAIENKQDIDNNKHLEDDSDE